MKQRKNTVTLALCQMHVKAGRVAENIRTAESMIARAAKRGADAAVLPEMWPTGFDFSRMDEYRRSAELKGLSKRTSQLAESLKVHLAAGSWLHFTRDGKKPGAWNRAHFFAKDGRLIAHYDKIHLFPPMLEDRFLRPGRKPRVFNSILGRTAPAICFDLRFPELFRTCALKGAAFFVINAAWPAERVDMMLELARARAIENQCFVALANCCGKTGKETFGGRSCVFAPGGRTVFIAPAKRSGVYLAKVDLSEVVRCRKAFPALKFYRRDIKWL